VTTDQESTTIIPEGIEAANRPFSALIPFAVIVAFVAGIFLWSSNDNPTASAGTQPAAATASAKAEAKAEAEEATSEPPAETESAPEKDAVPTATSIKDRKTPLRPPPNNACVDKAKHWCGKRISHAALIVDVGIRETNLPPRAWTIAVATAMQESTLENLATDKYPVTTNYNFDRKGADHDSVGIMQQRPSQGWGSPEELMDIRTAAKKFYDKLEKRVKGWDGWEDPKKVRLTDIAQKVQVSGYPNAYQKHEATATKIVDLVLQFRYTPGKDEDPKKYFEDGKHNNWLVMFQCGDPRSEDCKMIPWKLVEPVKNNRDVFAKHFPKAKLNGNRGDQRHQNAPTPMDHTPAANSCYGKSCNVPGWVYALDFGNGKAPKTGFDPSHFTHWLLDELRAHPDKYKEVKYIISRIPKDKGSKYYGEMHRKRGWEPHGANEHENHVHVSFMPGFERSKSTIVADYVAHLNGGTNKPVAAPVSGAAAGFPLFMS
jgi:hypothetical protein